METISPHTAQTEATIDTSWNGKGVSEAEQTEALKVLQACGQTAFWLSPHLHLLVPPCVLEMRQWAIYQGNVARIASLYPS